jgi:hypothetical protein
VVADTLSKRPSTYSMSEISVDWKSLLLVEYSKNKFACELMDGQIQDDRYMIMDDVIYYKGSIFFVQGPSFKSKVLQAFHDSSLAGHQGFLKTYRQIRERFYWKGLKGDFMRYSKECTLCQHKRDETHTSCRSITIPPYSQAQMEECIYGFYYRSSQNSREGLHLCGG